MSENLRIPIKDFREKLKLASPADSVNEIKTGEEDVPIELAEMKRENQEKKLLKYQLERNNGDVNQFLLNKYSNGEFNQAIINGYDNSEQRILHSITYDYHIYMPRALNSNGEDFYSEQRPPNDYIIIGPFSDKNNDHYTYHIPIYQYEENNEKFYKTDVGERLKLDGTSDSKNGLVYALSELQKNMKSGITNFKNDVVKILMKNKFVDKNSKIRLDVPGKAVEKYMKSYMPEKKKEVIEYLNPEFEVANNKENLEKLETEAESDKTITKFKDDNTSSAVKQEYEKLNQQIKSDKEFFIEKIEELAKDTTIPIDDFIDEINKIQVTLNDEDIRESREIIEAAKEKYNKVIEEFEGTKGLFKEARNDLHAKKIAELEIPNKIEINYTIKDEDYVDYLSNENKKIEDEIKKKKDKEEEEARKIKEEEEEEKRKAKEEAARKAKEKADVEEEKRKVEEEKEKIKTNLALVKTRIEKLFRNDLSKKLKKSYVSKADKSLNSINKMKKIEDIQYYLSNTQQPRDVRTEIIKLMKDEKINPHYKNLLTNFQAKEILVANENDLNPYYIAPAPIKPTLNTNAKVNENISNTKEEKTKKNVAEKTDNTEEGL